MSQKSPRIHQPSLTDRRLPREASLWRRFRRTKCPTLREELVLGYAPLVLSIAGRVHRRVPSHVDRRDLVSSGMVGLLAAIDGYDPEFPNAFAAYAAPRILGAIIDSLRKSDLVPRSTRERGEEIQFLSLEEPMLRNGTGQERPSVGETIQTLFIMRRWTFQERSAPTAGTLLTSWPLMVMAIFFAASSGQSPAGMESVRQSTFSVVSLTVWSSRISASTRASRSARRIARIARCDRSHDGESGERRRLSHAPTGKISPCGGRGRTALYTCG